MRIKGTLTPSEENRLRTEELNKSDYLAIPNHALAKERMFDAAMKRIRKANKVAQAIAHGGFGAAAKADYLAKWPEAKGR